MIETSYLLKTFFRQMKFSINLHRKKAGWFIVNIEGFPKNIIIFFIKIDFVLANSASGSSLFDKVYVLGFLV